MTLLAHLQPSRRSLRRGDHAREGVGSNGGTPKLGREGDPVGLTAEVGGCARPDHGLTPGVGAGSTEAEVPYA